MAITSSLKEKVVSTQNIRHCRYFLNYLAQSGFQLPLGNTSTADGCCAIINGSLLSHFPREEDRKGFIKDMEQHCHEELIDIENFEWLQKNDRACYWAWGYLRTAGDQAFGYAPPAAPSPLFYERLGLAKAPSSTKERFDTIVDFFDMWNEQTSFKLETLQFIKSNWVNVFSGIKPFKWLDKDDESQCKWTIIYLQKAGIPLWFLQPVGNAELYHAIIAAYDLWQEHPDTKKLFHIKISKAWSQKKHRDSLVGKKPLNTYLKEETKQKLDALSVHHDKKMHEVLERIIREEYDRAFN